MIKVEMVNPPQFVKPVGYSHMARVQGQGVTLLLLGGVTGMNERGEIEQPDDLVAQMDRALANVKAAVEHAGGRVEDIARMRIFTTDMVAYRYGLKEIGTLWRKHFGRHYPAMALLGASELFDPAAKVEIEAEAVVQG